MKTPKKSSQNPIPSQDESRHFNVLMEELPSKFRVFGEALSLLREDKSSLKPRFDKLEEKVVVLESAVRHHSEVLRTHSDAIRSNTEAIHGLKDSIQGIDHCLATVEVRLAS